MNPRVGGPAQGIRNITPALNSSGVLTNVVTVDDPNIEFGIVDQFEVKRLGPGKSNLAFAPELRRWLIRNVLGYDCVIVHGLWQYPGYCTARVLRQYRATGVHVPKLFVMPHGMLDPWFQWNRTRRWKALRNWIYWKLFERHTIETADGVLFTCEKELELARLPFRQYHPQAELNVGYSVPVPPPKCEELRSELLLTCPAFADKNFLLYLGRIHAKKGVDLLIRAYKNLLGKACSLGELPALAIAGPLDNMYAQQMQQLARELGLFKDSSVSFRGPGVFFPGMLQGQSKWAALHNCEAFILPSHQENFGISVVEALACGKPVCISDQVHIHSELAADGAALVEADTLEGTLRLLERVTTLKPDELDALCVAALTSYKNRYLPEAAVERLLQHILPSEG